MIRISALLIFALMVSFASAGDKKENCDPSRGVNLYSPAQEMVLGQQMAREVEVQTRLLYDDVVSEYINRLGQNLVRQTHAPMPFTIKVIDSDEVNAFALPGGFLYVNTGMIRNAHSEAELAGVLAHEIAHVVARHGTKQATRGQLVGYARIPLLFAGGLGGFLAGMAMDSALPEGFLNFSRGMEREADRLGLEYLYGTGYDPVAFIDFFERMKDSEKRKEGAIARLFSSHPMTGDRISRAQKEIQSQFQPRAQYVVDTSEFQDVRNRLEKHANREAIVVLRLNTGM